MVEIALNVVHLPNDDLVGTYRGGEQKMVDGMMAADAIELAASGGYDALTIVSNDDDFTPIVLSLARAPGTIQWLRRPRTGDNDAMLRREGVILLSDPAWP